MNKHPEPSAIPLDQQLQKLLVRYELLSASAGGHWEWDVSTNSLKTSAQWKESLGISDDALTGHLSDWETRLHPDDLEQAVAELNRHFRGETSYFRCTYRIRHANGHYLRVLDTGLAAFDEQQNPYLVVGSFNDITDIEEKEKRLAESENSLSTVLNCMSEGVLVMDTNGEFIYANNNFTKHIGLTPEQIKGLTPMDPRWRVIHADGSPYPGSEHPSMRTLETQKSVRNDVQGIYKGDSLSWFLVNSDPVFGLNGDKLIGVVVTFTDITEQKKNEEYINQLAYQDYLTGLANRPLLNKNLTTMMQRSTIHKEPLACLVIDLDRFKPMNDSFGHSFGDKVLCQVAELFKAAVRTKDCLARFGGDEFVVLSPNTDAKGASALAQRLINALNTTFVVEGRTVNISPSIGICVYPHDCDDGEQLLKQADMAMYRAKSEGGNAYRLFNSDINRIDSERSLIELELGTAIAQQQLYLHFQPQYDSTRSTVIGAEALLRWQHPKLGNVPPNVFITIAEESGAIIPIGEWVIGQVCQFLADTHKRGLPMLPLSINLSAKQLESHQLIDVITSSMHKHNIDSSWLTMEITESMLLSKAQQTLSNIHQLAGLGIKLDIDDFGTGFSSLAYLTQLPVSRLKIDRTFIKDIDQSKTDTVIAKTIIDLANNLSMKVIAEGVETQQQAEILNKLGCTDVQGFFFSRPLPQDDYVALLQSGASQPR